MNRHRRPPLALLIWRPFHADTIHLGLQLGIVRGGHGWAIRFGRTLRPLGGERYAALYDALEGTTTYRYLLGGRLTLIRLDPDLIDTDERTARWIPRSRNPRAHAPASRSSSP